MSPKLPSGEFQSYQALFGETVSGNCRFDEERGDHRFNEILPHEAKTEHEQDVKCFNTRP